MLLSYHTNAGNRTSPEQAADGANGQPIGREHEARVAVGAVHPRLGREQSVISGGFGNKSDHQFGGSRRIAGEKFRRAISDEQPEVRAPEFSDKPSDNFPVSLPTERREACPGEWRRWCDSRWRDPVHQPRRQLARTHGHLAQKVLGRLVILNNIEQLARPAAYGRLMSRRELMVGEKFLHERHGLSLLKTRKLALGCQKAGY